MVEPAVGFDELEQAIASVYNILVAHGYSVRLINYPREHDKRSIDIIAVHETGRPLLIKVVRDFVDLSLSELREMQSCSGVLHAQGIIVARSDHGIELDDIVAHERMGMYVVSVNGLKAALEGSIYVIYRQNNYYVKIDGKKLREKRLEKGYSFGDVAQRLSVTRRSVYMYEQGASLTPLSSGLKLAELFGEEILQPIDIIAEDTAIRRSDYGRTGSTQKTRLGRLLADAGYNVAETRYVPPSAIASAADARVKVVIVMEKGKAEDFEVRLDESENVAKHVKAYLVAIVKKKRDIASKYDSYMASSLEEAVSIMFELKT